MRRDGARVVLVDQLRGRNTRRLVTAPQGPIVSRPFNGQDVKQYPDRFAGFDCMISNGFPIDEECHRFLGGMTRVLTCETPYNRELYIEARRRGIQTYQQYNFEFQDLLISRKWRSRPSSSLRS
jgi:hypothetical protein